MATTTFHLFSDLPTELRMQILGYLVLSPHAVTVRTHTAFHSTKISKYSLVSKDVRQWVRQIYYGINTVRLSWSCADATSAKQLRLPPPDARAYVRHLELMMRIPKDTLSLQKLLDTTPSEEISLLVGRYAEAFDLLTLMSPHVSLQQNTDSSSLSIARQQDLLEILNARLNPQIFSRLTDAGAVLQPSYKEIEIFRMARASIRLFSQWQTTFTALNKLNIVFELEDCLGPVIRQILAELALVAETNVRAKSVEIDMRYEVPHRRTYQVPYKDRTQCSCRCADFVEGVFKKIMKRVVQREVV